ncbi:hypothetical protein [Bradyrhizobium sp. LB12.1]|uniref:hypothetical protein n=1 Tax=unclassified Bradyrhizobium TaxID=2631580 RepID=UPI0033911133
MSARKQSSGGETIGEFLHIFSLRMPRFALSRLFNERGVNDGVDNCCRDLWPQEHQYKADKQ